MKAYVLMALLGLATASQASQIYGENWASVAAGTLLTRTAGSTWLAFSNNAGTSFTADVQYNPWTSRNCLKLANQNISYNLVAQPGPFQQKDLYVQARISTYSADLANSYFGLFVRTSASANGCAPFWNGYSFSFQSPGTFNCGKVLGPGCTPTSLGNGFNPGFNPTDFVMGMSIRGRSKAEIEIKGYINGQVVGTFYDYTDPFSFDPIVQPYVGVWQFQGVPIYVDDFKIYDITPTYNKINPAKFFKVAR